MTILKMEKYQGNINMNKCRLNPVALALAGGTLWGISVFIMGIIATFHTYGRAFVTAFGLLYIGYEPTITGAIIGGVMGFIDAFLGAFIFGMLYNLFNHKGCGCCASKNEKPKEKKKTAHT